MNFPSYSISLPLLNTNLFSKMNGDKIEENCLVAKEKLSCNRDRKSNLQLIFCGKIHVKINIYFMYSQNIYIYILIRREATTTITTKKSSNSY